MLVTLKSHINRMTQLGVDVGQLNVITDMASVIEYRTPLFSTLLRIGCFTE